MNNLMKKKLSNMELTFHFLSILNQNYYSFYKFIFLINKKKNTLQRNMLF